MTPPSSPDGLRRTFPPPPRLARPDAPDGTPAPLAATWWGRAWVDALEDLSLDPARLARGRAVSASGAVDVITVTPGLVLAYVHGGRPRPYRARIRVRTLSDDAWEQFLDETADQPGHIAALLAPRQAAFAPSRGPARTLAAPAQDPSTSSTRAFVRHAESTHRTPLLHGQTSPAGALDKTLPHTLADGPVRLLPGPGDLIPDCSCPDTGRPCKHAAALCYQTARLLDEDPYLLFLMRGRGERDLLEDLARRNATRAAREEAATADASDAPAFPGVRATDALAARTLPPLPAPQPVPAVTRPPSPLPSVPGGPDPWALDQLATDAAERARALLATGRDPVAGLGVWADAVRIAADRPGSGLTSGSRALYASLASAADRMPTDLARAVAAWRQGGEAALAVLEEPWTPPAGPFDRANPALLAAGHPAHRPRHNHLTHPRGHRQLRLGRDGLWYAYESDPDRDDWWPTGHPDRDPLTALGR